MNKINYTIELSKSCPLNCFYCNDFGGKSKNIISEEILNKHKSFITYCEENKIPLSVSDTSGEPLLDLELIKKLFELDFYEYVEFDMRTSMSFSGADKKTLEFIRFCKSKNIKISFLITIHQQYYKETLFKNPIIRNFTTTYNFLIYDEESLRDFLEHKKKYKDKNIIFNFVMPFKSNDDFFDEDFIIKNSHISFMDNISLEMKKLLISISPKWEKWNDNISEYGKYFHKIPSKEKYKLCHMNENNIDFTIDGMIMKCANDLYINPKSNLYITDYSDEEIYNLAKNPNICRWNYCNLFCKFNKDNI